MRKIAANYILLPGFEFVKNGYVVLKDGMVVDVVIYIPELDTKRSINFCVIPLFDLSISIRSLLEAIKAISIPEKNADKTRQINMATNPDI